MPSTPRSSLFERHPRSTLSVIILVALLVLDVIAANLVHAVLGQPLREHLEARRSAPDRVFRTPDVRYHHGFKPDIAPLTAHWGHADYIMATNSEAMKDAAPREIAPRHDGQRILLMGDSFTEGIGVSHGQTFAGRIAAALAPRGIEVLNAGVSSYAPIIHWRRLKHLLEERGLHIDEVVIYLDLSDVRDQAIIYGETPEGNVGDLKVAGTRSDPVPGSIPAASPWISRHTLAVRALRDLAVGWWQGVAHPEKALRDRYGLDQWPARWTFDQAVFHTVGAKGIARMKKYMDRVAALCDQHGIGLTVAVYPWPDQTARGELDSLQVLIWREWAEEHGAGFINHFPDFIDPAASVEQRLETIARYHIRGDSHWNEAGHARIAEGFLRRWPDTSP
ncbi:MAG: SGNH/GDSL hydrolase family protein [Gammaproteobacteria bacterium]